MTDQLMTSKTELLQQQRAWSSHIARAVDERGYVFTLRDNLFQPLSTLARDAFSRGNGSELQDVRTRPSKMKALHSSAALAVNVFDYWIQRDSRPLLTALGLHAGSASMEFEAQFPTGLNGNPPNLDLAFRFDDGEVVGIESKFTEWLTPKAPGKELFKPKYFADKSQIWAERRLPNCQSLAEALHIGEVDFRYLDAAQLLKHTLGLATQQPGNVMLYYIYFDWHGPESIVHTEEIERFALIVRQDIPFHYCTYQEVYRRLVDGIGNEHSEYLEYLSRRYFPNAT